MICSDATGGVIVMAGEFNCAVVSGAVVSGAVVSCADVTGFCMICPDATGINAALSFLNAASTAFAKSFASSTVVMEVVGMAPFKLVIALYKSLETTFFVLSKRRTMLSRMESAAAINVEPHELSSDDLSIQVS